MVRAERLAGRFDLIELAGSGGMGRVYRATDTTTGAEVAVKVMIGDEDGQQRQRFESEARILSDLDHPAIVRHIAHGITDDGNPFLAMEWLHGEDLRARLRRGPLPLDAGLRLLRRVCEGLSEAHARGVVHRDIKPSNIFLCDGDVAAAKLLDFGVARATGRTSHTRPGAPIGTPGYLAPEQARGDARITPAADVFALGCVLFEAICGRPTFQADNVMAVLAKLVFGERPRLADHCPDAPPALDELVERMLASEPHARPPGAAALLAALDGLAGAVRDRPARGLLTAAERRVISVLLLQGAAPELAARVAEIAAGVGGRVAQLTDGTLALVMSGGGAAKDRVASAAMAALAIRQVAGERAISLATGHADTQPELPIGETIERAARRLGTAAALGDAVAIDTVTAGLLDARYTWRSGPSGAELVGENAAAENTGGGRRLPTPFVGRDGELRLLIDALRDCASEPSAQAFVVFGPSGAGKSRLAHELIATMQDHRQGPAFEVWSAHSDPSGSRAAFALLERALRTALGIASGQPLAERQGRLRAAVRAVMPQEPRRVVEFLGELCGCPFVADDSPMLLAARVDPRVMADQVQLAFQDYLEAVLARRPVLLVLDDMHWGDMPTIRALDAALESCRDLPFFVLALARPDTDRDFSTLWANRRMQQVHLGSLSLRAAEELVRTLFPDADAVTAQRLARMAEGNAFHLEELARSAAEGARSFPETLLALAQARIEGLEAEARRLLRAASIYGTSFAAAGARALLPGGDGAETREWLALLVRRGVLVRNRVSRLAGQDEYAFRHILLREGAYAMLTENDRILGHALAGDWLERHGESDASILAEHFERGRDRERAAQAYLRAAELSRDARDSEGSRASAERGLALGPPGELRGALLCVLAEAALETADFAATISLSAAALALVRPGSSRWSRTCELLFHAATIVDPALLAQQLAFFIATPLEDEGRPFFVRCVAWLFGGMTLSGMIAPAMQLRERMRAVVAEVDRRDAGIHAYARITDAHVAAYLDHDPWRAASLTREAAELLDAAGIVRSRGVVVAHHGNALRELGRPAEAEAVLRGALAEQQKLRDPQALAFAGVYLARALLGGGAFAEADELASAAAAGGVPFARVLALGVRAAVARAAGDLARADELSQAACAEGADFPLLGWENAAWRVLVLLDRGRVAEAVTTGDEALALIDHLAIAPCGEVVLCHAAARARGAAGDTGGRDEALRRGLRALERSGAGLPDDGARARYREGVPEHAALLAWAAERAS